MATWTRCCRWSRAGTSWSSSSRPAMRSTTVSSTDHTRCHCPWRGRVGSGCLAERANSSTRLEDPTTLGREFSRIGSDFREYGTKRKEKKMRCLELSRFCGHGLTLSMYFTFVLDRRAKVECGVTPTAVIPAFNKCDDFTLGLGARRKGPAMHQFFPQRGE